MRTVRDESAAVVAGSIPFEWCEGPRLLVPVVDARRNQVFYGLYSQDWDESLGTCGLWTRRRPFAVCDRSELKGHLESLAGDMATEHATGPGARSGGGLPPSVGMAIGVSPQRVLVIGADECLAPELGAGMQFQRRSVEAQWLLLGQERLDEPGALPEGNRLSPWVAGYFGEGEARVAEAGEMGPAGAIGSPESVKPIYVRSPDADMHIKKMRDPWADLTTKG